MNEHLPALVTRALPPAGFVCGNCRYCGHAGPIRECRRRPPQLMCLALAGPSIAGGPPRVSWISNGAYPPVGDKTPACGEFEARPEVTN